MNHRRVTISAGRIMTVVALPAVPLLKSADCVNMRVIIV